MCLWLLRTNERLTLAVPVLDAPWPKAGGVITQIQGETGYYYPASVVHVGETDMLRGLKLIDCTPDQVAESFLRSPLVLAQLNALLAQSR